MTEKLDGFTNLEANGGVGLIRDGYLDQLMSALMNPESLETLTNAGRGTVRTCRVGNGLAVVREYRRGGFVQNFLKKHYLFDNRPWRELQVWDYVHRKGLRVPTPLGAYWKKSGPAYSGAFASEYIDAPHLEDWLNSNPDDESRATTLHAVGQAIRQMHDLGVLHADLQVRNVLIDKELRVYIIDFDNAKVVDDVTLRTGDENLQRFQRSLLKRELPPHSIVPVLLGYGKDRDAAEAWVRI